METDPTLFDLPINLNNFPAKLWCLVNSPDTCSIRWDSSGETVIIDQPLFEAEFLSPTPKNPGISLELFKTNNYNSFIRQLNLYGFRKVAVDTDSLDKQCDYKSANYSAQQHFYNPNFKQGHPELLANLKRLTSTNKAKIEAGIEVTCRPPTHTHRFMLNSSEDTFIKGSTSNRQTPERRVKAAPSPYHSSGSQQLKPYDRTPVPPRTWNMGYGDVSSPTHLYTDKGVPVSMIYHLAMDSPYAVPSSSTTIPQGPQMAAATNHKFSPFLHHHPQYQPGFYTEVFPCSTPSFMDPNMAASYPAAASYSHYSYYPNYTLGYFHPCGHNPDWSSGGSAEVSDVNMDTVFRIADEHQRTPKVPSVKVCSSPQLAHLATDAQADIASQSQ